MTTQDQAVNLELVSKITVKTLDAQPARHTVKDPQAVAAIYGRCTSKEAGTSDHGEFVKFKGEFEGTNMKTGKVYRSGVLIVPKVLEELLNQAVTIDGANSVDFAVKITVKPNDKSITGYSYGIEPLIKPAESDALAQLRQVAMSQVQNQIGMATEETTADLEGEAKDVTPKTKK